MNVRLLPLCLAALMAFLGGSGQARDDKKTDGDFKVPEGKEFSLTPVEVTAADAPNNTGLTEAKLKPAKEPVKVKMPRERWTLGFYPKEGKGPGVEIDSGFPGLGLMTMRAAAGMGGMDGTIFVEPGDVITHVNGYAVNTVEEVICAASLAKDKSDVQIVVKDVKTGTELIVYVTATKP